MKILVFSQFYEPDITAAAFRISETCNLLRRRGHQVQVITAQPHKSSAAAKGNFVEEPWVLKLSIRKYKGRGVFDYLLHYLSFASRALVKGLLLGFRFRPEVIWASSPPLFCGSVGALVSMILRVPLILDVRDIWPDSAVAAGMLRQESLSYQLARLLEKFTYRRAHRLTCVSNSMRQYLVSELGHDNVVVIFNGVLEANLDASQPAGKIEKRVVYAGNLGRAQGVEMLVDCFLRLVEHRKDNGWELVLVGDGALKDQIEDKITRFRGGKKAKILAPMLKPDLCEYLKHSGILYIGVKKHPSLAMTIPSKVFDYMAVNRPIVAAVSGESANLIRKNPYNRVIAPEDGDSLTKALVDLIGTGFPSQYPQSNHQFIRQKFTREAGTTLIEDVFRQVIVKGSM